MLLFIIYLVHVAIGYGIILVGYVPGTVPVPGSVFHSTPPQGGLCYARTRLPEQGVLLRTQIRSLC